MYFIEDLLKIKHYNRNNQKRVNKFNSIIMDILLLID